MATTCAALLPSRGPASSVLAARFALGALFAEAPFFPDLAFEGAALALLARALAVFELFGFDCSSALLPSPSFWMRSQIRAAPALALLNLWSSFTPGRLFQM